jgi:hypothetical protein
MSKIDVKEMIKPKFNSLEFDGVGMHANLQRPKGMQS